LLFDAVGVVLAVGIVAVDEPVVVVVDVVVADLRLRRAVRREEARRIGAVDLAVAVVVLAVVANLLRALLARGVAEAVGVLAVDETVAVVVDPVRAVFGHAGRHARAREDPRTVGIGAVDEAVTVVVLAVAADLPGRLALACRVRKAVRVVAVD